MPTAAEFADRQISTAGKGYCIADRNGPTVGNHALPTADIRRPCTVGKAVNFADRNCWERSAKPAAGDAVRGC